MAKNEIFGNNFFWLKYEKNTPL